MSCAILVKSSYIKLDRSNSVRRINVTAITLLPSFWSHAVKLVKLTEEMTDILIAHCYSNLLY